MIDKCAVNAKFNKLFCASSFTIAAVLYFLASPVAMAQSILNDSATSDELGLNEIVVSARKRDENLRDVPISVAVLGRDRLAVAKINKFTELASNIPSFVVSASIIPSVYVRGFGSGGNTSIEQSVGKFVDNVAFPRDQDVRLPLFDLERVEVLKGPQVLLFGSSSTADALNITTRKPSNELAADLSIDDGFERNQWLIQGGVTLPINEKISVRIAGYRNDLGKGHVYNVVRDEWDLRHEDYAGRIIVALKPVEELEIRLKAEYDQIRTDGTEVETVVQPLIQLLLILT